MCRMSVLEAVPQRDLGNQQMWLLPSKQLSFLYQDIPFLRVSLGYEPGVEVKAV